MRTDLSLRRQLPRKCSRDGPNRLANVVNDPFDEGRIVSLCHHSNERFSSRLADDEPATPLELSLGSCDSLPHAIGLERLGAAVEPDVLEQLRKRFELLQQLTCRSACLDQRRQDLEPGDEPVAGGRVIGENDVTRLLPPDVAPASAHLLEHVAIADLGPKQFEARFAELSLEPEVRHDRRHDGIALEFPATVKAKSDESHQLVPIDELAFLVGDDQPVCITVEGKADVRSARDYRLL